MAAGRWRLWLGAAAVALGLVLTAWRLIPVLHQSTPDAPPLQSADPAIRLTEVGDGVVIVYADVTGARDAADNFDKAAATVSAVGQALKRGVSDDLRGAGTVRFSIRCQAINRFGQDVMAQLVTLEAPLPALRAVDYARTRPADVLGLAQTVKLGAPGAYDAIAAWCADPARSGKAFCAKVQAGSNA
ncbi:MAG: hypothetical protein ACXWKV_16120 [Caulobacteraceae bacterium]